MNKEEYLEQNAKGYEGDEYIGQEIAKFVNQFGVNLIVETGTYRGATTKRLAEFTPVWTVEIMKENYDYSFELFKAEKSKNITPIFGNSVQFLRKWLPEFTDKSILFFLDAHWQDYVPLIDELKVIAENDITPVIVIHDFKVPGRPDLGFDSYKGQDYTFEWIKPQLDDIYGVDGYLYAYNDEADGAKRGVIYIYPISE
jgi:predicted O-methyltransferase YrrM